MPEDNKQGSIHSSSDGGTVGNYPDPDPSDFLVAPATSSESNALKFNLFLAAFLCISDIRFKFDSSFVLPAVQIEMKAFLDLRNGDPQVKSSPISIFGHADPSFQGNFDPSDSDTAGPGDDYNKTLSGRRAISIYALLIRDSSLWDNLYKNHLGSDVWGEDSIRTMLSSTGQPAADDSTVVGIANNSGQRQQLFLKYMNSVCGDLKLDKSADFLARGAGSDLKGDVQGCSRFNPLLVFNSEDEASFKEAFANNDQPTLRGDRDVRNSVNRRVMILIFKKGTQVLPAKWPCPTYKEGVAGCKKRFFKKDSTGPDGDTRRSTHNPDADRKFELTRDTFACRFYQRISGEKSPCNSTSPPPPRPCNPTVSIGHVVRGNPYVPHDASTADGMPDSVPPSKTYEVEVTVANWIAECSGKHIDLSIANTSNDNGTATISPAQIADNGTFKVTVTGGDQTKPGNGGKLKIQAKLNGAVKAESPGFTVCAHPIDLINAFAGDVNGGAVGMRVSVAWHSDSGTFTDLDEAEFSEVVKPGPRNSPPFATLASSTQVNSGYMASNLTGLVDTHTTGRPSAGPAGSNNFDQLFIFKCHRCGANDKNQPNSGFNIIHEVFQVGATWKHHVRKVGATVTIGANTSQPGTAGFTSPDHTLP
jgi:hypothetical protein